MLFPIKFGGHVVQFTDERGVQRFEWTGTDEVMAMDTPVPGFGTGTVNNMRLWSAKASHDFNLKYFNEGNYLEAVKEKNDSENLSNPETTTANVVSRWWTRPGLAGFAWRIWPSPAVTA